MWSLTRLHSTDLKSNKYFSELKNEKSSTEKNAAKCKVQRRSLILFVDFVKSLFLRKDMKTHSKTVMTKFGSRDYSRQFAVSNRKETKQSCQNEKPNTFWLISYTMSKNDGLQNAEGKTYLVRLSLRF